MNPLQQYSKLKERLHVNGAWQEVAEYEDFQSLAGGFEQHVLKARFENTGLQMQSLRLRNPDIITLSLKIFIILESERKH